jgi:hypothetical protein
MRRHILLDSFNSFDRLELKLCQTSLSVAAVTSAVLTPSADSHEGFDDKEDPLPNPEPPPPQDPGNDPPIVYPGLPSSGPPGPG